MPPIPSGFAEIEVNYNLPGGGLRDGMVTFGLQAPAYDQTNCDAVFDIVADNLKTVLHNHAGIFSVTMRDSLSNTFESGQNEVSGTASGTISPPQVCFLLRKITALGGRRNRGRLYLPGVREAAYDDEGKLTSTANSELVSAADGLIADLGTADMTMEILHSDGGTPTDVTSLAVGQFLATQRRRLKRGH